MPKKYKWFTFKNLYEKKERFNLIFLSENWKTDLDLNNNVNTVNSIL